MKKIYVSSKLRIADNESFVLEKKSS